MLVTLHVPCHSRAGVCATEPGGVSPSIAGRQRMRYNHIAEQVCAREVDLQVWPLAISPAEPLGLPIRLRSDSERRVIKGVQHRVVAMDANLTFRSSSLQHPSSLMSSALTPSLPHTSLLPAPVA